MKITVVSMIIRVREISSADVEETKDLFRDMLDRLMTSKPGFIIQGLETLPKCVGVTTLDRRTLFSGMVVRRSESGDMEDLRSFLLSGISDFLKINGLEVGPALPNPISIEFHHRAVTGAEFVQGRDKAIAALQDGPKTSSQLAETADIVPQVANILLCLVIEECLAWREETDTIDDIFHSVESGSLEKTEAAVRRVLQTGPLSREEVFQGVKKVSGIDARREWIRKTLKDLVASGKVTKGQDKKYSLST